MFARFIADDASVCAAYNVRAKACCAGTSHCPTPYVVKNIPGVEELPDYAINQIGRPYKRREAARSCGVSIRDVRD
jgi:hypothetical protein